MKNKDIQPTPHERVMHDGDFIVSKTDPSGRITYANRTFMEFSGYDESELLGTQHNIIRHPDMPRGIFKFLWDTVQAKEEFFGYVKNLSKDGGFYWVFAHVTPDLDEQERITGYFSVRRKPKPDAVRLLSTLYAEMLEAERRAGPRGAIAASLDLLQDRLASKGGDYEAFILQI